MKIRINGNTIRMRLTPEEVDSLVNSGAVSDTCQFPGHKLRYGVFSTDGKKMDAVFSGNDIRVFVPGAQLNGWNQDGRVGFEHTTEDDLYILVEKDFQCLHPRKNEQEAHLYPNPTAS